MKKRFLLSAFVLVLCAGVTRAIDTDLDDGVTYYKISGAADLDAFAALVNAGDTLACARVTASFTADSGFTPIGDDKGHHYAGTFDGGGFTITLGIDATGDYMGLFGCVGNCTIKNVTVAGKVSGRNYVGGLVGMVRSNSDKVKTTIINCHNKADISGTGSGSDDNGRTVGGIVGLINNEMLESGTTKLTGGTTDIDGCSNSGNVSGDASSGKVGGIVGYAGATLTISRCMNSGVIKGETGVGGIIGMFSPVNYSHPLNIKNSANLGSVSGNTYVGSLVGGGSAGATVTGCYNSAVSSFPTFAKAATVANCFDVNSSHSSNVMQIDTADVESGALCYKLNSLLSATDNEEVVWYQKIAPESYPDVLSTKAEDEANVVNKGTLKEYGSTEDGSDVYFNSKTLAAENGDATKFYLFELVGATDVATSYLKETVSDASKNILVKDGENYYCANAILVDKTAYSVDVAYTAANFTYDRTLAKAGINTFILPIATSASNVNGKVYKLTSYEGETLKFDEVTTLEANTPYLVQTESDNTSLLAGTLEDVVVSAMTTINDITAGSATHIGSYSIQKSSNAAESGYSYYGYSSGSFVKATGTWTLNPFRTMIKIAGTGVVSAKSLNIQLGDETSGIVNPSLESSPVDVYTASGVKVRSQADSATALQGLPTGIYIVGGKKVMKK